MHVQASYMPSRHRLESQLCPVGVIDRESINTRVIYRLRHQHASLSLLVVFLSGQ